MPQKAATIYRVDTSHFDLDELNNPEDQIRYIVSYCFKVNPKFINHSTFEAGDVDWLLYSYTPSNPTSGWETFLPYGLSEGHHFASSTTYLILFAVIGTSIYYIQGGRPNRRINRFTRNLFGVYVLCALYEIEDLYIQRVEHRPIEGIILVNDKAFIERQTVDSVKRVGYVPMKIDAQVGRVGIDSAFPFGSLNENTAVSIKAADGFKLTSELSFEELSELIQSCDTLYNAADFSTVSDLVPLTDVNLIDSLNAAVIRKVFENQGKLQRFDIAVLHPSHPLRYVSADQFTIVYDRDVDKIVASSRVLVLPNVIAIINRNISNPGSERQFFSAFGKVQVHARWRSDRYEKAPISVMIQTSQPWRNVASGAFTTYLKLAGRWFTHTRSFLPELNRTLIRLLNQAPIGKANMLTDWKDGARELVYNWHQQTKLPGSICLDGITPQGIEICDLIYFESDVTYLIHVKKGFNASMRDLCYQAIHAHSYIQAELAREYSDGLFAIYAKAPYMFDEMPFHEFTDLIRENPWKFVVAIAVKSTKPPEMIVQDSRSTVAKLSLIDLISTFLDSKSEIGVEWVRIVDDVPGWPENK